MKLAIDLFIIVVFFYSQAYAQVSSLVPQASTSTQDSLIKIGTGLHDEGKYDEAIKTYQQVLVENPSNVVALYELSYSLFAKKDYAGAIKYSTEGAKYKSRYLPLFYLNIGNALDLQGKTVESINTYRQGILLDPKNHLFPYNLGLTFYRQKNLDSARFQFHKALELNPSHSSSNLALANTYRDMGKPIPRLFALSRFLILEPTSQRSKDALNQLQAILSKFVSVSESNSKVINITVTPDSDAVDGDLTVLEMSLATTQATRHTEDGKGKTDLQWTAHAFESFFQIMLELTEKESFNGFCWKYYVPYYVEMQRRGFTEAFVYLIFRCLETDEVNSWLKSNIAKAKEFIAWNKNYQW
jgi:tetratricopeptide (TPR) repeat protein